MAKMKLLKIAIYGVSMMATASTILCVLLYCNSYEWTPLELSNLTNNEPTTLNKGYCSYTDAIKYGAWVDTSSNLVQTHYQTFKKNNLELIPSNILIDQYKCPSILHGQAEVKWNCSNNQTLRALSFEYYLKRNINNTCKLFHLFDAEKFLNLINNTNLYIIGDSQSWQHYLSLICRLTSVNHSIIHVSHSENSECNNFIKKYVRTNPGTKWISYNEYNMVCMKLIVSFPSTNTTITMIRSNFLMTSLHRFNASYFYEYWNMMLFKYMSRDRKHIILINNGAHWHGHRTAKLLETVQYFAMLISKVSYNNTDIIYRTILHGHPNCQKYDKLYSDNFLLVLKEMGMPYAWHTLGTLDKYIINSMNETNNRLHIWNVSDFFRAMSVGHPSEKDCFHYCMPGPLYWWNVLLYHFIDQFVV